MARLRNAWRLAFPWLDCAMAALILAVTVFLLIRYHEGPP